MPADGGIKCQVDFDKYAHLQAESDDHMNHDSIRNLWKPTKYADAFSIISRSHDEEIYKGRPGNPSHHARVVNVRGRFSDTSLLSMCIFNAYFFKPEMRISS